MEREEGEYKRVTKRGKKGKIKRKHSEIWKKKKERRGVTRIGKRGVKHERSKEEGKRREENL